MCSSTRCMTRVDPTPVMTATSLPNGPPKYPSQKSNLDLPLRRRVSVTWIPLAVAVFCLICDARNPRCSGAALALAEARQ